ncbi:helix-turn-helix transcriptional regulator [Bacillus sp. FJAT-42315]|uniref:helix-turn-helix transcriptional regulator n=1 Tax=Bacillus sp. FJAT-42315 TaxID=2014077 RepID=UPI000C238082|nr:helix-turn-helix transcriptional regulator [Bacillus sp. FJAT-42315]
MRDWLIQLRKNKSLTQANIAEQVFIDRSYYAQIEQGKRDPSIGVANQIAKLLKFHPSLFYSEFLENPLGEAIQGSPVVVAHCDLQLRYTWIYNPHLNFHWQEFIGKRDDEIMMNEGSVSLMDVKRQVIEKDMIIREKIWFPISGRILLYDVYARSLKREGRITGAMTVSTLLKNIENK